MRALFVDEFARDAPLVSIPRSEIQLVVRFGPAAPGGLDVHAFGPRHKAHRKVIRAGQRAVTARFQLGAAEAVLGVSARVLAGRILPLDSLWGVATTRRFIDRLAAARTTVDAAAVVESAIAERLASANVACGRTSLALAAAERLANANVNMVADELDVSERHLRRVFREATGVSPKEFAKLARFHRALRAARAGRRTSWARIAAATGYYDQAHLIAEFRAITGVTPPALLAELALAP